jgi:hypothetical protein
LGVGSTPQAVDDEEFGQSVRIAKLHPADTHEVHCVARQALRVAIQKILLEHI